MFSGSHFLQSMNIQFLSSSHNCLSLFNLFLRICFVFKINFEEILPCLSLLYTFTCLVVTLFCFALFLKYCHLYIPEALCFSSYRLFSLVMGSLFKSSSIDLLKHFFNVLCFPERSFFQKGPFPLKKNFHGQKIFRKYHC